LTHSAPAPAPGIPQIGGAATAKWYRSIRVLPYLEHLGSWLARFNLPVRRWRSTVDFDNGPAVHRRKYVVYCVIQLSPCHCIMVAVHI
jgi:hypothetical protein